MNIDRKEVLERLRSIHLFNRLNEQQLEQVYYRLELYAYAAGEPIYAAGAPADSFFILFTGRVLLSIPEDGREREIAVLEPADYFGEEALSYNRQRRTNATTTTRSSAFRLTQQALAELAEEIPALAQALVLAERSLYLRLRARLRWRGPRETVLYITRRHPFFLGLRLVGPVFLGLGVLLPLLVVWRQLGPDLLWPLPLFALGLLSSAVWALWTALDWTNDYSILTNERVVFLEKVALLYESRQEVPLEAILGSEIRTNQWGRWLGYGDIVIRTYTGHLTLSRVAQPDLVLNMIQARRNRLRRERDNEHRSEIRSALYQRLAGRPAGQVRASRQPGAGTSLSAPPGHPLREVWISLFRLRHEVDGVTTYWTHWWMLARRVWLPSLVFLILGIGIVLVLAGVTPISALSPLASLLILFGLGFLTLTWWVYLYIDWRNDRYQIANEQLVDIYKKPLGIEQKRTAPIRNIQSIEYQRHGIIGLLLNFGTVSIRIGDTKFTFDNVYNPSEVQRELFHRFMQYGLGEKQRSQEQLDHRMVEWIENYHQMTGKPEDRENPPRPDTGFE